MQFSNNMTFPNVLRLIIPTLLLLLSVFYICEVHSFGARRNYHSYHHLSQRSSTNKRKYLRSSQPISTSKQEDLEAERILEKAAEIRRYLAQREGKTLTQLQEQREETERRDHS